MPLARLALAKSLGVLVCVSAVIACAQTQSIWGPQPSNTTQQEAFRPLFWQGIAKHSDTTAFTASFPRGPWGGFQVKLMSIMRGFSRTCDGLDAKLFGKDGTWLMSIPPQLTDEGCVVKIGLTINKANYERLTLYIINRWQSSDEDTFYDISTITQ